MLLVDDMDYMMNTTHPYYLPMIHKHLRLQGTEFPHFVTSVGNCCPSRTSLLTGRHCHNTNLTANDPPHGSYIGFKAKKLDKSYLPLWLQAAGYRTFQLGKVLNGFKGSVSHQYGCLPGWDHSMPPIEPQSEEAAARADALLQRKPPVYLSFYYTDCAYVEEVEGEPDINLFDRAFNWMEEAVDAGVPFFTYLAAANPHDGPVDGLPRVEAQYAGAFAGAKVPRGPNYGVPTDPRFGMSKTKPLWWDPAWTDKHYRTRAQSMLTIDQQLDRLVTKLECLGILNNTYIFFTSDNGFKLGQHNIPSEKFTYFEEDVALPFFIRGPGVPRGAYANTVQTAMVDITATILAIAGGSVTPGAPPVDGGAIPLDLLRSLHPRPNSPFYNYSGAYWNAPAGTDMFAPPATSAAVCARASRPPPMPPTPPPAPPCKSKKCKKAINSFDETDDAVNARFAALESRSAFVSGAVSGRGLLTAAAGGGENAAAEGEVEEVAAAGALEAVGSGGGSGAARRLAQQATAGGARESTWANLALIEQWKYGKLWRGKDYRVIRACMPPNATIAASAAGSKRGGNVCYKYVVFCNIDNAPGKLRLTQLFNLSSDEAEVHDMLLKAPVPAGTQRLVDRLDAALTVLSYCSGSSCAQPFTRIHPDGSVVNLAEAMDPKYDSLYAGFKKLDFKQCADYYDPSHEIPDLRLVPPELFAMQSREAGPH
ncbi:hypothetical protein HYH02_003223 [Chlamydomonas schloesseri]|uniref:Sulfatase N-terminal domain-containing protein n=1 Tax=Chlamydomonas schloesseri TaxID=2026947 RepID=A0A835WRL5_9CHLO|nr:hypothetical protein HYH02_003223 [Chlamydomonas schloesseri]|eukprot:KAG2452192.1 hypothetical protein HYH02_003223 [Chlamydomonas schloesseri]